MFKKHTTREGMTLLICEMTNSHLSNQIRMVLRGIRKVEEAATAGRMTPYQASLYGVSVADPNQAGRLNREAWERLYPYLAEAYVRGLDDGLLDDVRTTLGRAEMMNVPPQLPESAGEYFLVDYSDPTDDCVQGWDEVGPGDVPF